MKHSGVLRRTPLKKRGRRGHLFLKGRDPHYLSWLRTLPCCIPGRHLGMVQACHVMSRGRGGVDFGNTYPGCAGHHAEQHTIGMKAFEAKYGLDLTETAQYLGRLYEQTRRAA